MTPNFFIRKGNCVDHSIKWCYDRDRFDIEIISKSPIIIGSYFNLFRGSTVKQCTGAGIRCRISETSPEYFVTSSCKYNTENEGRKYPLIEVNGQWAMPGR